MFNILERTRASPKEPPDHYVDWYVLKPDNPFNE